jgi:riboflavin kinase / FMN adenylyltransferase
VLSIGSFDGVHLGHQALIKRLLERSAGAAAPVVVTFEPHPRAVLDPDRAPQLLTLLPEKTALLEGFGIEHVIVVPFDRAFAEKSPREFMAWLEDRMHVEAIVCGGDFAFGRRRAGSIAWLREQGYEVVEVGPVEVSGMAVRSSAIRGLVGSGEVAAAAELLDRAYTVSGVVVRGHQRGRELGYPTANLELDARKLTPGPAAYAGYARGEFGKRPAAISVGHQPTFGGDDLAVEAYLLDFDGDLYGQELEVAFVERLHPDTRYPSVAELVAQIGRDVAETRRLLAAR